MKLFMRDWLLNLYYEINTVKAGVIKRCLSITNNKNNILFSYYEKGKRVPGQPIQIIQKKNILQQLLSSTFDYILNCNVCGMSEGTCRAIKLRGEGLGGYLLIVVGLSGPNFVKTSLMILRRKETMKKYIRMTSSNKR
ncbi:unnamed protein product [Rotaria sp. Silwood1]|nr:unnamed protein product [Rotaria sp. Silwood1]CAF5114212.1 unnamed protein product [Rotaria sp. Silwood1]